MGGLALSVRGATEADLDRLVEIHTACYPDARGPAARRLNFLQKAFGSFDDLRVAVSGKRLVGHGFGFSFDSFFGGRRVPSLGIASVGVAPEARGRGVASAILNALEREARERGAAISILHAFRHGFYARRGYAEVGTMRRLSCDPRSIPRAWIESARKARLRTANASDVASIIALHARAAKRSNGFIDRPETWWTRTLTNERLHTLVLADVGYVTFEITQSEEHARTVMVVSDLVAETDEARRTLWGFLGLQAEQIAEIEIEIVDGDPIAFALTDSDARRFGDERVEHELGGVIGGPMIKVLDVPRALASRGYSRGGVLDVKLARATWRMRVKNGRAAIGRVATKKNALALDERALASIAFGGLSASDAARLDLVRGDKDVIKRADSLFRGPPFFTLDRF